MGYTETNNYGFQKPAKENAFTVDDLNNALDKIDETIKSQVDTLNESLDALDNKIDEVASKSGISFATRLPDGTTYSITTKSGSSVASGEWTYPISFILDPGIYNLTLNILSQTYTMEFVVTDIPVIGDISDIVCMLNISNLAGVVDISYDSKHIATSDDISYSIGVPKSASQHTLSFTATASYGNGVMPFTIAPIPITPNTPSLDVPVSRSITINLITSDLPSFTVPFNGEYEIIAVGGGGAGGSSHGGGGGGYITVKTETLNAGTPYAIIIGEGGTSLDTSGGITSFSNLVSASGGGGGTSNGGSGGSGGGGAGNRGGNGGRGYFGGGGGGGDGSGTSGIGGDGGAGGTYGGGGGGGENWGSGGSKGTHGGAGGRGGRDTTQPTDGNAGTNTTSMDLLFKGAGNAGSAGSYRGSKNGGGGGGGGYGGNGGSGSGSGGEFGGGGGGGYGGNGGNARDGGGGGGGYGGNGGSGGSVSDNYYGGGGGGYGTSPASTHGSGTGYGAGGSGHSSSFSGKSGCVVVRMIS